MIDNIINMYELGALSIKQLFQAAAESRREIIDVEYEDLSDQIPENHDAKSEIKMIEMQSSDNQQT